MKADYDQEMDALYLSLGPGKPEGVIEVKEGINIDISKDGKIIGIEILDASKKLSLKFFYMYGISPSLLNLKKLTTV
jgi:uncharacterized protein YuzE